MKSVFDSTFRYTRAAETDLRKTFAKVRRRIREAEEQRDLLEAEVRSKVSPILKQNKNLAV
jgi:hypothetical protein